MPRAKGATGLIVLGLASWLAGAASAQAPKQAPAKGKPADPMKEPLRLIARARAAHAKLTDYSCTLIKRERLEGELTPNHVITLKVRKEPLSVSMVWQEPKDSEGQEVVYVAGKYDGKMRVKMGGFLGSIGFVSVPIDDPRTLKVSRHKVTDAGMGPLIERFARGWEIERQIKQTQVRIGTFTYAKRKCTRVELTHRSRAGGKLKHFRNVVYFDQETGLPIRVENYDWPDKEGEKPALGEVYSYVNLRLNPGLPADVFDR
jgi:hypothetical protein